MVVRFADYFSQSLFCLSRKSIVSAVPVSYTHLTESVTTEQKAATESNTEAAKAESTASVTAIQKKTAVKSVKQGSDPVVTNGDFTKYLTKFAFTDHLGNPFTESHPVTKDSNVIIRYEFKIPNKETIQGGSTYICLLYTSQWSISNIYMEVRKVIF